MTRGRSRRGEAWGTPAVLTVAGADPSGASGVYRDVATFEALDCAGVAAVTAVTAQNTSRFTSAEPVSARMISAQIGAVFEDFDVRAVKVGMVRGREAVAAVRAALLRGIGGGPRRPRGASGGRGGRGAIPVVVDPVVKSTTGGRLLDRGSLALYKKSIVPLAAAVTPNVHELGVLAGNSRLAQEGQGGAGRAGAEWAEAEAGRGPVAEAARAVLGMGAGSVVVTGMRDGRLVRDIVFDGAAGAEPYAASGGMPAVRGRRRGSGCTHSAALAAMLASGAGLAEAARAAAAVAYRSIANAVPRGAGLPVAAAAEEAAAEEGALSWAGGAVAVMPAAAVAAAARRLEAAAASLAGIDGIGRHIPECQTNIAYAPRPGISSPEEAVGLDGRIVSTMSGGAIVPGRAALGASRHVAAALVEASRRFPAVRAAANIRYDPRTVDAARRLGMAASSYDRAAEPAAVGRAEGASVPWGVRSALRGARRPRDVVYHAGGMGKEPMAIVFGTSPRDVVSKIARIAAAAGRGGGGRSAGGPPRRPH